MTNVINAAVPFFLLPIITSKLTVHYYGILSNFQIFLSLLIPFISINSDAALARRYYEKNDRNILDYLATTESLSFIIALALFCLTFVSEVFLKDFYHLDWIFIRLAIIIVFIRVLMNLSLSFYQASKQPFNYAALILTYTALNVGISLVFLVGLNYGWESRVYGQLIACGFVLIWFQLFFRKGTFFPPKLDKGDLRYLTSFGIPLLPQAFFSASVIAIDRFVLTGLHGASENGIFSLGFQMASILSFFTISLNSAFVPWFYEKLNSGTYSDKRSVIKLTYIGWLGIIAMAIILIVIIPIIFGLFVDKKFVIALEFIPVLITGFVFQGLYFLVSNYFTFLKQTKVLGKIALCLIILKLPVSYILINTYGIKGASYSFLITYCLYFLSVLFCVRSRVKMPWNILD